MVEPGTAVNVSVRFGRLFLHAFGITWVILPGFNLNTLHDLFRVI